MFQLTKEEYDSLKCQNGTSNTKGGDRRALPYAFTQQGIGMLSGLLRSQVAIDTNIRIMRAFVNMRRFIIANMQVIQRLNRVEMQQMENKLWIEKADNKINQILDKMEERSQHSKKRLQPCLACESRRSVVHCKQNRFEHYRKEGSTHERDHSGRGRGHKALSPDDGDQQAAAARV
jgi:hypothetical protein